VLESVAGITLAQLLLVWLVTVVAAILRAFTGFGFALAAVPAYALFLSPAEAVVLSASLSLCIGAQTYPQYAHHSQAREHWLLYACAVVGTVLGARLLQAMDRTSFQLVIGVVTILASVALSRFHPRRRDWGRPGQAGTGVLSGLVNGAFAIPGPPVIIYAMATQADPARSRAFMIGFFTFSALMALGTYAAAGLVSLHSLWLLLLVYPAIYLGDKLGYRLFTRHGGAQYRRVAIVLLMLLGVSIVLRGLLA